MNKQEMISFIVESITEDYYGLGDNVGMQKNEIDEIVSKSHQTILYISNGLYSRMKEKNLIS